MDRTVVLREVRILSGVVWGMAAEAGDPDGGDRGAGDERPDVPALGVALRGRGEGGIRDRQALGGSHRRAPEAEVPEYGGWHAVAGGVRRPAVLRVGEEPAPDGGFGEAAAGPVRTVLRDA